MRVSVGEKLCGIEEHGVEEMSGEYSVWVGLNWIKELLFFLLSWLLLRDDMRFQVDDPHTGPVAQRR